jgi:hypothetical protein
MFQLQNYGKSVHHLLLRNCSSFRVGPWAQLRSPRKDCSQRLASRQQATWKYWYDHKDRSMSLAWGIPQTQSPSPCIDHVLWRTEHHSTQASALVATEERWTPVLRVDDRAPNLLQVRWQVSILHRPGYTFPLTAKLTSDIHVDEAAVPWNCKSRGPLETPHYQGKTN